MNLKSSILKLKAIGLNTMAFFMGLMILLSSINWSVNAHYCGDAIIHIAFIGEAESCGMPEVKTICSKNTQNDFLKGLCCSNRDLNFSAEDQVRKLNEWFNSDCLSSIYGLNPDLGFRLFSNFSQIIFDVGYTHPPWLCCNIIQQTEAYRL